MVTIIIITLEYCIPCQLAMHMECKWDTLQYFCTCLPFHTKDTLVADIKEVCIACFETDVERAYVLPLSYGIHSKRHCIPCQLAMVS